MIPFNIPPVTGRENEYIKQVIEGKRLSGDGPFTHQCSRWIEKHFNSPKVLLTTSCTHALEMAAILLDLKEGDEVIMPSYTFVSTANAFVLRGAKIVFVDIRPDTMNIDETLIEAAITERTKAIVPVHYAGVACEMDTIMKIALEHNLLVIEDAAQGVMSLYNGRALGTIGHLGCYSFHETKNYSSGEGGALLINDSTFIDRAEIIREKGTNRSRFLQGQVDKYTWVDIGSSYLPSELNAAYLFAQLELSEEINTNRLKSWNRYYKLLKPLENNNKIVLPYIPETCSHNAHMFYIKVKDVEERTSLIQYLKERKITSAFHYVPLHNSEAGEKHSTFYGKDVYTTKESERLIRLPLFFNIPEKDIDYICNQIHLFFSLSK
ncbi:dTDP-4-amino-4,6-dideoxygalactose transaminase [Bacillus mesophilus]|uniref:dTDP-4-amino-4,6-dideoxygalactose transaminase n=1 Tax=Bacillus mesophilus TaxID=1808955 RepID=A0A6M0Q7W1_9BACI|nr:dTDP-4-amino-4,6-dideoxygalactose transaminase [Bacillus mesophilus]MBM7661685.1 dTDP-4-amino-4,6-dideoxygalactose transaminase [Bacillus mesophilus]NEY72347.1 dTDP-4-amino-4,6-dideoxygalactose transaminase [Bacillus mesophilus]